MSAREIDIVFENACQGAYKLLYLSPERLNSWHKLQREAQRDTMTALERQRQLSEWKQRSQAGRQRLKDKRQGG